MLLAVNIGNSNIRFAVVEGQQVHLSWTIATKPYRTAGEFYMSFQSYKEQYKKCFWKNYKDSSGFCSTSANANYR